MTYLRLIFFFLCGLQLQAQNLSGILQKAGKLVEPQQLNSADISAGLKEALTLEQKRDALNYPSTMAFLKMQLEKSPCHPKYKK